MKDKWGYLPPLVPEVELQVSSFGKSFKDIKEELSQVKELKDIKGELSQLREGYDEIRRRRLETMRQLGMDREVAAIEERRRQEQEQQALDMELTAIRERRRQKEEQQVKQSCFNTLMNFPRMRMRIYTSKGGVWPVEPGSLRSRAYRCLQSTPSPGKTSKFLTAPFFYQCDALVQEGKPFEKIFSSFADAQTHNKSDHGLNDYYYQ